MIFLEIYLYKKDKNTIFHIHVKTQLLILDIECHSNPCQNEGICTDDQNTGHTCHCPLGFTGNNCENGIVCDFLFQRYSS